MSIIVEHDKRKEEIVKKAIEVFIEEGFQKTTYQKVADRCGLTRTTLYVYFKNKKEIFTFCVKQLSSDIENQFKPYMRDKTLMPSEKLKNVLIAIFTYFKENQEFLSVILDYLLILKRNGGDPHSAVRRRTIRLRRYVAALINQGISKGEFASADAPKITDVIFSILESTILRVTIFNVEGVDTSLDSALELLENLKIK